MLEDSEAGGRITGWDKHMQKILWALARASPPHLASEEGR